MEKQRQRQILFILLWVLIAFILILLAVNVFFVYHLYFAPAPTSSKEDLVEQTLTAVDLTAEGSPELSTATPEPPTATLAPTETPILPTGTSEAERDEVLYIVNQGDTVPNLAEFFGVKLDDLRGRNQMLGDFLLAGQKLNIPVPGVTHEPVLEFSSMLSTEDYIMIPQTASSEDTTINIYMEENLYAFQAREQLDQLVKDAFDFTKNQLDGEAPVELDVYIASHMFEQAAERAIYLDHDDKGLFILHDGSGNLADLNFHLAYGMAVLWGEEVWGGTPDRVLREGMAYSMANQRSFGSGNLELCDVAYAYQVEGKLPDLTNAVVGTVEWTRDMVNLSTAGCYYQYLTETYPADEVKALYTSGDYAELHEETFIDEVALFENWLQSYAPSQEMDAAAFVEQMDRLLYLNGLFFSDVLRWEYIFETYYNLDQARLGLWRNDVRYALVRMTTAEAMLGLTTHTVELTPTPDDDGASGGSGPSDQKTPEPGETPFATWTPWPTWTPFWKDTPEP